MKVLHEIDSNQNIAIALGYFDGMHIGHKKLIETLIKEAKQKKLKTAVVTFDRNPADYFNNEPTPNIITFKDREIILSSLGVDYLYELNFEEYKNVSATEYIENILIKNFSPKIVVAGYNHTFGKDKVGNSDTLLQYADKYKYKCIIIPEQKHNGGQVSATVIRKKIKEGQLINVKSLLGRYFSVRNSVIKGEKIASKLGYPTANLVWPDSMVRLPYGVYYGYVKFDKKIHPALISWGTKPTLTNGENEMLEVHIHDFKEDLYGKIIKVLFAKKIRDVQKFSNINTLKAQLQKDCLEFTKWVKLMS